MAKFTIDEYGQTLKNDKLYHPKDWKNIFKNIGSWIAEKLLLPIVIPVLITIITNRYLNK
jgi:hypothetical protein